MLLGAQQFVDCDASVSVCHGGLMDNVTQEIGFHRMEMHVL